MILVFRKKTYLPAEWRDRGKEWRGCSGSRHSEDTTGYTTARRTLTRRPRKVRWRRRTGWSRTTSVRHSFRGKYKRAQSKSASRHQQQHTQLMKLVQTGWWQLLALLAIHGACNIDHRMWLGRSTAHAHMQLIARSSAWIYSGIIEVATYVWWHDYNSTNNTNTNI